nr:MAG TPA: hypothetical protein [Caudoviricetes sp.]
MFRRTRQVRVFYVWRKVRRLPSSCCRYFPEPAGAPAFLFLC